jgi:hypothetical protein
MFTEEIRNEKTIYVIASLTTKLFISPTNQTTGKGTATMGDRKRFYR